MTDLTDDDTPASASTDGMQRGYARAEAKNAEIRAGLNPLAPDERPWPLLASIVVVALLALLNAVGYVIDPERVPLFGVIVFCAVMGLAIYGLWKRTAWGVLGTLTLFGLIAAFGMLSVLVASNVLGVVVSLATIAVSGTLFWKLIRVLGRIQVPKGELG